MDSVISGSKCTRCGKPRITVRSYEEKTDSGVVVYTETACSDPECQKIVDKGLQAEKAKRKVIKEEQVKREEVRKQNSIRSKASKE